MNNKIPEVPWRFGERYLAIDFVMAKNVAMAFYFGEQE